jgi:hypothetical protein
MDWLPCGSAQRRADLKGEGFVCAFTYSQGIGLGVREFPGGAESLFLKSLEQCLELFPPGIRFTRPENRPGQAPRSLGSCKSGPVRRVRSKPRAELGPDAGCIFSTDKFDEASVRIRLDLIGRHERLLPGRRGMRIIPISTGHLPYTLVRKRHSALPSGRAAELHVTMTTSMSYIYIILERTLRNKLSDRKAPNQYVIPTVFVSFR